MPHLGSACLISLDGALVVCFFLFLATLPSLSSDTLYDALDCSRRHAGGRFGPGYAVCVRSQVDEASRRDDYVAVRMRTGRYRQARPSRQPRLDPRYSRSSDRKFYPEFLKIRFRS